MIGSLIKKLDKLLIMSSCRRFLPNITDLSRKTKKLWFGQASLRRSGRSGRKNQTKTMSPFVRRGDIIIKRGGLGSTFDIKVK
jgi:hypothetical protein